MNARWFEPSTNAVYLIRKLLWWGNKKTTNYFTKIIKVRNCKKYQLKLIKKYGIFVSENAEIDIGLRLPHPNGIIIGANGIGKNVTIFQQVTIGSAHTGDYKLKKQPYIGDDCILFTGAKVIGDIRLAKGTKVAAGAVLTKGTVEQNGVYAGVPASLIKK